MKTTVLISLLLFVTSFGLQEGNPLPEINQSIVAFVQKNIGKKIGRGECWDLAANALNEANANWDGQYTFGKTLKPLKDSIFPGDIIQFEKVSVFKKEGNEIIKGNFPRHTAIVYQVYSAGKYQIAEQNTSTFGRKVGLSNFELSSVTKGKVLFYRPVKN
jgi:hypothetical protein